MRITAGRWVVCRVGSGTGVDGVLVRVLPSADSDAEELTEWPDDVPIELAGVDEASVAPLTPDSGPRRGRKGLGVLAGQLLAQVSTLSGLRAIVSAVHAWAARQPGDCRRTWERGGRAGSS